MLSYLSDTLHRITPDTTHNRLIGCHRHPNGQPERDRLGRTRSFKDPILDADSWATHQVEVSLRTLGMYVTPEEKEEFVSDVVALLLKAEANFAPDKNPSFAGYVSWLIPRRLIDIIPRALLGRNGGRIAERSHEELDERTANRHQGAVTEEPRDLLDHHLADHGGLQRNRTGETTWAHTVLGVGAA